jgi:sodium/hydrogen antiporter
MVFQKVVHGLSIPLGKLGFYLPRTLSHAFDSTASEDPQPFRVRERAESSSGVLRERRRQTPTSGQSTPALPTSPTGRPIYKIGGTVIRDETSGTMTPVEDGEQSTPSDRVANRTIRFPDETHVVTNSGRRANGEKD